MTISVPKLRTITTGFEVMFEEDYRFDENFRLSAGEVLEEVHILQRRTWYPVSEALC